MAEVIPLFKSFAPETLAYRIKQEVRQERERLIEALSRIEPPAVRDHTTGAVLEFLGFRPFLNDIIKAIQDLDDIDNNW
jgi:hypothetical protein